MSTPRWIRISSTVLATAGLIFTGGVAAQASPVDYAPPARHSAPVDYAPAARSAKPVDYVKPVDYSSPTVGVLSFRIKPVDY
jgi:hypothetical protein